MKPPLWSPHVAGLGCQATQPAGCQRPRGRLLRYDGTVRRDGGIVRCCGTCLSTSGIDAGPGQQGRGVGSSLDPCQLLFLSCAGDNAVGVATGTYNTIAIASQPAPVPASGSLQKQFLFGRSVVHPVLGRPLIDLWSCSPRVVAAVVVGRASLSCSSRPRFV